MADVASHLVDRVFPSKPVRQYVLSFPHELSRLAAIRPEVLAYLCRVFWEAVERRYTSWAKGRGLTQAVTGAVTGVQRFGSSLNVHVHFHLLALDGVYVVEAASPTGLRFEAAPPPSREDLEELLRGVHRRVSKWLEKKGYVKDPDVSNERPELSLAEQLVLVGAAKGTMKTLPVDRDDEGEEDESVASLGGSCSTEAVVFEGFNLHAEVTVPAHDDLLREKLCRYINRPPFSLSRLSIRKDGMVVYRVKKVGRRRARCRVMTPLECIARLVALVPPPRYPLCRMHGALAPRHKWRARVVPRPPPGAEVRPSCTAKKKTPDNENTDASATASSPAPSHDEPRTPRGDGRAAFAVENAGAGGVAALREVVSSGAAEQAAANVLSLAHWARLDDGRLYAPPGRMEWALLLRRTWGTDALRCPHCDGRLRVHAVVTSPAAALAILASLHRPRPPPPREDAAPPPH